jgi:iron(III) transport system ATP-binding protein
MSARAVGVTVEKLTKTFGDKIALAQVSLSITPGTFTVLLGPSGSGKTTLLRCLAGIERPTTGSITLDDALVVGPGVFVSPDKRHLAMVFQDYALWPHLTVARNVGFALEQSTLSKQERADKVMGLLARVGIERLAERYPNELSGGEQQRVALARALAADVGLLLFDEPLSNLDADRREGLRIEIATLARESGATVVYITHDQSEAFALADVVGVLNRGELVQWASPEEVYQSPASSFVARFTGLAGEIPVTVSAVDHGVATVTLALSSHVTMTNCPTRCDGPGAATLFIRPSAVTLRDAAIGEGITAIVEDSAFIGRGYEHVVLIDETLRFTKIFSRTRFGRGSVVGVEIDSNGVYVMKDDA